MNNRRQELERTLPEASSYMCQDIWTDLAASGLTHISKNDLVFIGRLTVRYLRSPQGVRTILRLLGLEPKPASILKTFFKAGRIQDDFSRIKSTDLQEIHGYIYKNSGVVPAARVDVVEKEETNVCDACGGWFPMDYCIKTVEILQPNGHSKMDNICNYCRYHSDQPRVRESGNSQHCMACEKITCDHHPKHSAPMVPIALLPAAGERAMPNVQMPQAWR